MPTSVEGLATQAIGLAPADRALPSDLMLASLLEGGDSEVNAEWEYGLGRRGTADEVAQAVVHLASSSARFITGQVLHVNGGT